jgi:hypothetical protein
MGSRSHVSAKQAFREVETMDNSFDGGWITADDESAVVGALSRHGLVLVEGLAESADVLRLARSVATVVPHRDSASGLCSGNGAKP